MKRISELIAQLQAIQAEHGDLRVFDKYDEYGFRVSSFDTRFKVLEIEADCYRTGEIVEGEFVEAGTFQRRFDLGWHEVLDQSQKPESFTALIIE